MWQRPLLSAYLEASLSGFGAFSWGEKSFDFSRGSSNNFEGKLFSAAKFSAGVEGHEGVDSASSSLLGAGSTRERRWRRGRGRQTERNAFGSLLSLSFLSFWPPRGGSSSGQGYGEDAGRCERQQCQQRQSGAEEG